MRPPLHQRFVDKSAAAITSAVKVYNKPAFAYREETFAILALNAWELLLKAKVLKDAGNAIRSLRVYEPRTTRSGEKSRKLYLKLNRVGSPQSISLHACVGRLTGTAGALPVEVKANLDALTAVRDNSIHFVTASATLAKQVSEVAAASVQNFVCLAKQWFNRDFSSVLNLVLPLSFVAPPRDVGAVTVSADETKLIAYLKTLAAGSEDSTGDYSVALRVQVKFEKSNLANASKVVLSRVGEGLPVAVVEKSIRDDYPWDYGELCRRLSARYVGFKQNASFHAIRIPLMKDDRYAKSRLLDPAMPKGLKKDYYNSNILQVFDQHFTKKA